MLSNHLEEACAALCLLTCIAWDSSLPPIMTRLMVHRLKAEGVLRGCKVHRASSVDTALLERAKALLARADRVKAAMDIYGTQGYTFITQNDERWPKRLNNLPPAQRPHLLFAKGNLCLLSDRTVAVTGSRDILPYTASLARRAGQMLASEGLTMVSGGARGVDTAAHKGTLELGGQLILVPAKPVKQLMDSPELAEALKEERLLILCDAPPDEHFSAQKAIARNHVIYALGKAALVIAAREGIGGSWHGAADCLRGGYTPVYVADGSGEDVRGNASLRKIGAGCVDLLRPLRGQMCMAEQMSWLDEIKEEGWNAGNPE